jgi:uncharacterized protein
MEDLNMNDQASRVAAIRGFYAGINSNDIDAAMADLDAEIVRIEPSGYPMSGTYIGLGPIREMWIKARSTWAEGTCEPQQFFAKGDVVVAFAHVHVRLHDSQDWLDGDLADVFTFRDGKIVKYETVNEQADALESNGMDEANRI